MSTFNIGDACVILGTYKHPEHLGVECTIVSLTKPCPSPDGNLVNCMVLIEGYLGRDELNGFWWVHTDHLKLKQRKEALGSWDAVEAICGWNPTKGKR